MPKRARSLRTGPITRDFCARLTAAREARGWSKYELADAAALTRQRVIHLEQGIEHPRLFEVELLAIALDVDIAALLGLESRKDDEQDERSAAILEDLSTHLLAAVDLVMELLKDREAPDLSAKTPEPKTKGKVGDQERAAWQWEKILPEAERLLREQPERSWRPTELVRGIRESGLELKSYRGLHFAIIAQLRSANLINEGTGGEFTAKPVKGPESLDSKDELSRSAHRATAAVSSMELPSESELSVQLLQPERALHDPHDSALHSLAQEIEAVAPRLIRMTQRERTAQVAVWAGRARQMQDEIASLTGASLTGKRSPLRPVFTRLGELEKSLDCGSVDALSPSWSTDWKPYIEVNRAVSASDAPLVTLDQKRKYFQDGLRALLEKRTTKLAVKEAPALIIEASQVLDESDPWLVDAVTKFGKHGDRRSSESIPADPFRRQEESAERALAANAAAKKQGVPKSVLKASRGKRLLIAGGQGSHEALRLSVRKALQFKAVDWITGERNPNPVELFALAVRNKRYDIVLLMSGTAPPDLQLLIAACKEVGASLYFLPVTPSIPSVAEAIFAERVVGGGLPEWMETPQSAMPTRKPSGKSE